MQARNAAKRIPRAKQSNIVCYVASDVAYDMVNITYDVHSRTYDIAYDENHEKTMRHSSLTCDMVGFDDIVCTS